MNRNWLTGRVGEFLAAAILEQHDVRVAHVDIEHDDLWAKTPSGRFYQVQVKSASTPRPASRGRKPTYQFHLKKMNHYRGILILVAIDRKRILCMDGKRARKIIRLQPERFTRAEQTRSIITCFDL